MQFSDFFGITMGTYIIGFIGHSLVEWARAKAKGAKVPTALKPMFDRRTLVVAYFLAILGAFAVFGE